ncbi:helix-turn-helix transcriptional regulator [Pelagibacterium montanilacus]|uniref:helix-turn-helix transcriptional regulator n=1 Tax=Pelagibacterium montanilacus TaxID=2185280 RepID=UPI000F8E1CD9|nr:DNA-binding protein [Pelagibacterium montanilacus]
MSDNRYLTATEVRARFGGISDMTLWRWLEDDSLNFPRPMKVRNRRLFKEQDIIDWEARRTVEAAA